MKNTSTSLQKENKKIVLGMLLGAIIGIAAMLLTMFIVVNGSLNLGQIVLSVAIGGICGLIFGGMVGVGMTQAKTDPAVASNIKTQRRVLLIAIIFTALLYLLNRFGKGIIFGLTLNWTKLSSGYLVAYGVAVILPLVNAIAVTISSKVRTYCKKTSLRVVGLAGLLYLVCLLFLWIFKREWHFQRSSWL
ncbi:MULTISPECIES: hypothetical protein [Lactobacillus]|uniref:hypothetical protein n=1 Tax=Lactobacillus TaxID=1578 RepID=UPI000CD891BF|nr:MULTISPECIES: hypothetical protein [Lactobacillus]RVU71907.1 hypothetical protein EJK20_11300 [Lactobacillus xujianguonis]